MLSNISVIKYCGTIYNSFCVCLPTDCLYSAGALDGGYLCACSLCLFPFMLLQYFLHKGLGFHFSCLGCSGWGRVDLIKDVYGNFQLLEINTVPGLTETSLVPKSSNLEGIDFNNLILRILNTA